MRKCNACGRRFRLLSKNRYEVMKSPVGLSCLTKGVIYYNAFDCPYCGCQNIVGVIEKVKVNENTSSGIEKVLDKIKAEVREWYWQADKQALAKDPCVVDGMTDLFIRTIDKYMTESEVPDVDSD